MNLSKFLEQKGFTPRQAAALRIAQRTPLRASEVETLLALSNDCEPFIEWLLLVCGLNCVPPSDVSFFASAFIDAYKKQKPGAKLSDTDWNKEIARTRETNAAARGRRLRSACDRVGDVGGGETKADQDRDHS